MIIQTFLYINGLNFIQITPYIFALNSTLCHVIPIKWRSYRDHRFFDVISPYIFTPPVRHDCPVGVVSGGVN